MTAATNPALHPAAGVGPAQAPSAPSRTAPPTRGREPAAAGRPFAAVLDDATNGAATNRAGELRFSKHALERVQRRGIPLDQATLGRLQSGVGRIAAKGARDSLVLVDGTAFVVSVPNRTVITAVGAAQMRDQVFTNIDSAVIA